MKVLTLMYRFSLTGKHLIDCIRLAIIRYTANSNKLDEDIQCQV
jgi:hypothetical protein